MNNSLDKALYYLTGNGNIDAVKVEEFEKLVNNHPYFPVAHFLLSKKLKNQNRPGFLPQVQKTALYFPNPYWLHYQLLNDLPDEPIIHDSDEPLRQQNAFVETSEFTDDKTEDVASDDLIIDEPITDTAIIEDEPIPAYKHPITTVFTPGELQAASDLAHETLKDDDEHETTIENIELSPLEDEVLAKNAIAAEEEVEAGDLPKPAIEHTHEEVEDDRSPETINEHIHDKVEEDISPELTNEHSADIPAEEYSVSHEHNEPVSQPEEEMAAITRDADETTSHFINEIAEEVPAQRLAYEYEDFPVVQEIQEPEEDEHEKMFQNIKAMLDASSDEAKADVKNSVVPIDPYYTIDYFAAQGIKLDLEKNPQDKLGKQVKKFTQWLRHMKKLGPEDALAAESSTAAEMEAQQTADASNIAKEVVTEAMALVLEKQGKKEKAIQLYRKLTFLNPHKSVYFADKINHLNSL